MRFLTENNIISVWPRYSAAMPDKIFIKRRQRARTRPFLTLRIIIGLMILSLFVWAGFYFEYGTINDDACTNGKCENLHSLKAMISGFAMMFMAIIISGSILGGILSLIKRYRRKKQNTLSVLFTGKPEP